MSDEYIKSERIVENTWQCTSCQETNRGRDMKCVKCGSPKEFDEEDIVPDAETAETVTDPELLKQANAGENWQCEYCMCQVRNSNGDCQNCAAKRDEANSKVTPRETERLADLIKKSKLPPVKIYGQGKGLPNLSNRQLPKVPRNPIPFVLAGTGVAILGLLIWALVPTTIHAKVSSTSWNYTTLAYIRQLNHGTGWGTPSGAFNAQCETKYKGQVQCHPHDCNPHQVGYTCHSENYQCHPHSESYSCNCTSRECNCHESCRSKKNGYSSCTTKCSTCRSCSTCSRTVYDTCERHDTCYKTVYDTCYDSCPVYDQWCQYDFYTWPLFKTLRNDGNNKDPIFPEFVAPDQETYRTEHVEKYLVEFTETKKKEPQTFQYDPKTLVQYRKFTIGDSWDLKKGVFGVEPIEKP